MTGLSDNALHVLRARYLRRAEDRSLIETPDEMFARVAHAIAAAEKGCVTAAEAEELFRACLTSLDFLPNSPTLMNAGAECGQLSACFVLPVEDSIESIFEAVKRLALIQRTGGGTGFSFSRLRPRGDFVELTGGESSGPVSFLKVFDAATEHIKQGGRRRGANMGILRVDHPDILEFVAVKSDGRSVRNFNLSAGVTDAFMEAVRRDDCCDLIHPRTKRATARVRARKVFDAIVQNAWLTGDPGLVFLDTINRANPTPHLGDIEATNPCGEVPLLPHEACNLGSINLAHMLRVSGDSTAVDWDKLRDTTRLAVRFLDDVIDANHYPFPEIEQMARGNRKIGLGVMGFADMLIGLGISYDSDEAVVFADELMSFIATEAQAASCDLAAERGVYPNWPGSRHAARGLRVRNATCAAIAPTGTIGIIADASPGIEPLFALAYRRTNVLGGETLSEASPLFVEAARRQVPDADRLIAAVAESGSLSGVPDVPEPMRRLFVTAHEIPADRHLEIQAAFQRHVDNSVSKTINLPAETTPEEVSRIYQRAWELGLKGITVFRQGCRPEQVMEPGLHAPASTLAHAAHCDPGECDL